MGNIALLPLLVERRLDPIPLKSVARAYSEDFNSGPAVRWQVNWQCDQLKAPEAGRSMCFHPIASGLT
jgi:hypothetical protein